MMFDNIGGKIKTLALVCTIIGMVTSCICGLVLLFSRAALLGIMTAVLGCLSSWISSFILYGFGELIEQQRETNTYSAQILKLLQNSIFKPQMAKVNTEESSAVSEDSRPQVSSPTHQWLCNTCGRLIAQSPCPYCGNK